MCYVHLRREFYVKLFNKLKEEHEKNSSRCSITLILVISRRQWIGEEGSGEKIGIKEWEVI